VLRFDDTDVRIALRGMITMYEIKIESSFSGAHRLRDYNGQCENLHGHNWKVEVIVVSPDVGKDGMVLDFRELKEATRAVLETMDHRYLNEIPYFSERNPSSENIAKYIFDRVTDRLGERRVRVTKVTAWESDGACASYYED
jgi:6-pyruvoyltetrahydropterin/6-carboxytetrahydropterin synthase